MRNLHTFIFLLVSLSMFAPVANAVETGWYDLNYTKRKLITVDTAKIETGSHVDFPVLLEFTAAETLIFSNTINGGRDIRFTAADGVTLLPHDLVRWDTVGELGEIWVIMPVLSDAINTLFIYYDNSTGVPIPSPHGAWPDDFKIVHHFEDNPSNQFADNRAGLASVKSEDSVLWTMANSVTTPMGLGWNFGATTANSQTLQNRNITVTDSTWTMLAWIRKDHSNSSMVLMEYHENRQDIWASESGNSIMHQRRGDTPDGLATQYKNRADSLQARTWHLFAFRSKAATTDWFKDGVKKTFPTVVNAMDPVTGGKIKPSTESPFRMMGVMGPVWVTNSGTLTGDGFNGKVTEFVLTGADLSDDWIKTYFNITDDSAGAWAAGAAQAETAVAVTSVSGTFTKGGEVTILGDNMGAPTFTADFLGPEINSAVIGSNPANLDSSWDYTQTGPRPEVVSNERSWSAPNSLKLSLDPWPAANASTFTYNHGSEFTKVYFSFWMSIQHISGVFRGMKPVRVGHDGCIDGLRQNGTPSPSCLTNIDDTTGQVYWGIGTDRLDPPTLQSMTAITYVHLDCNNSGCNQWINGCDTSDSYMVDINGTQTNVSVPNGYTPAGNGTQHVLNSMRGSTVTANEYLPRINGEWVRMEFALDRGTADNFDGSLWTAIFRPSDGHKIGMDTSGFNLRSSWNMVPESCRNDNVAWEDVMFMMFIGRPTEGEPDFTARIWTDDHYVQTGSFSRIELADASTWSNVTRSEIQEPTSWANDEIVFEFNPGGWASNVRPGSLDLWFYVIGEDNKPLDETGLVMPTAGRPKFWRPTDTISVQEGG